MAQSANAMACNCRGGPFCCMRAFPYMESGVSYSKTPPGPCAICSAFDHEVAAHIGSVSHPWPRFHNELAGECEQFGDHKHYSDANVIIWKRAEVARA